MKMNKITFNELQNLGYPSDGKSRMVAIQTMLRHYQKADKGFVMVLLKDILINPLVYKNDEVLGKISEELINKN